MTFGKLFLLHALIFGTLFVTRGRKCSVGTLLLYFPHKEKDIVLLLHYYQSIPTYTVGMTLLH